MQGGGVLLFAGVADALEGGKPVGVSWTETKFRNPKHEIRNKLKIQKDENIKKDPMDAPFEFSAFFAFGFVSLRV